MIEIIALGMLAVALASFLLPVFQQLNADRLAKKVAVPQDSVLRRHFLTHIRTENALLADALEKRLAKAG